MGYALTYLAVLLAIGTAASARHLTADQNPLSLAKTFEAVATDNTVILTQTSCGYLEFAVNWITHAEALGVTNWLTIAEDQVALDYINSR